MSSFNTLANNRSWRSAQIITWVLGVGILAALFFRPALGIHAFWNVLIPVAPAILVLHPGLWRNICPLAVSTAMVNRRFSPQRKLTLNTQGKLCFLGVTSLYLFVPLRHVFLDTNGAATATFLVFIASVAIVLAAFLRGKSGWCASLCAVHGVEKLYGQSPGFSMDNAQCTSCVRCVGVCPDAKANVNPLMAPTSWHRFAGLMLIGGFPGFVWGWFQVPDYAGLEGFRHLGIAYGYPLGAMTATFFAFLGLYSHLSKEGQIRLVRFFAASAVSLYYWFRIPALVGYGIFPGDGMLADLSSAVPFHWVNLARLLLVALFFFWLLPAPKTKRQWGRRPPFRPTGVIAIPTD